MFLTRNKKNNVYPCKPQFYYIKVGFKGVNFTEACFRDVPLDLALRLALTINGSNYPYIEQISMVSKMLEQLKFDTGYEKHMGMEGTQQIKSYLAFS